MEDRNGDDIYSSEINPTPISPMNKLILIQGISYFNVEMTLNDRHSTQEISKNPC